ncbi:uncharacterized protein LOC126278816 [Schistocerca gregaria]|uniref:uncharacterized protein LOC126278816 n=1 Tax=Schistocerca gregaria TaxID=7010 RepID=UPI00211EE007|nr:uncharacterized protein LOC126278816 [Schistocerca gregaria]
MTPTRPSAAVASGRALVFTSLLVPAERCLRSDADSTRRKHRQDLWRRKPSKNEVGNASFRINQQPPLPYRNLVCFEETEMAIARATLSPRSQFQVITKQRVNYLTTNLMTTMRCSLLKVKTIGTQIEVHCFQEEDEDRATGYSVFERLTS